MTLVQWKDTQNAKLACAFSGDDGACYFLALNADAGDAAFRLPGAADSRWKVLLDTSQHDGGTAAELDCAGCTVAGRSLVLLMRS